MALPHARLRLLESKSLRMDPLVDDILNGKLDAEYRAAKRIYDSPIKKSYVESCMLATEDLEEIQETLDIPVATLNLYREIFYDVVGYNKLDKLEAIETADTAEESSMKLWALSQGMDFIRWRLGKAVSINPVEGLKDMFSTCVYKSKEALFSGNVAEASKEAVKWTKLSMDIARLLKHWTTDVSAARHDIELALSTIDPTFKGFDAMEE